MFHYLKQVVRKVGGLVTQVSRVSGFVAGQRLLTGTTLPALSAANDELKEFGAGNPSPLTQAEVFRHEDGTVLMSMFTLTGSDNGTAVMRLSRLEPHYKPNSRFCQWVRHPVLQVTVTAGGKVGATPPAGDSAPIENTERSADTIAIGWDRSLPPLRARVLSPRDSAGTDLTPDEAPAILVVDALGGAYFEWQAGTLAAGATGVRVHNKWL